MLLNKKKTPNKALQQTPIGVAELWRWAETNNLLRSEAVV
jgi:hypothetical protein